MNALELTHAEETELLFRLDTCEALNTEKARWHCIARRYLNARDDLQRALNDAADNLIGQTEDDTIETNPLLFAEDSANYALGFDDSSITYCERDYSEALDAADNFARRYSELYAEFENEIRAEILAKRDRLADARKIAYTFLQTVKDCQSAGELVRRDAMMMQVERIVDEYAY